MITNSEYLFSKKEIQNLIKRSKAIYVFDRNGIQKIQFVFPSIKSKESFCNVWVHNLLSLKVYSKKEVVHNLQNAIRDLLKEGVKKDEYIIIKGYTQGKIQRNIKVTKLDGIEVKEEKAKAAEYTNNRPKKRTDFTAYKQNLYNEDGLCCRFNNGLPYWLNNGFNGPIRKRVLAYSALYLYKQYPNLFKGNIYYRTKINRPVQYVNGYDVDTSIADDNSIYYFRRLNTLKNGIDNFVSKLNTNDMERKSQTFDAFVDYLFKHSFALFYCNLSWGRFTLGDYQKYGLEILWYFACRMITSSGAMDYSNNSDWIPDFDLFKMLKKFYIKVQGAKVNWNKYLGYITPTKSINKCLFPKGYTKQQKDEWKESKGITRKVQDKSKRKSQVAALRKQTVKSREQLVKETTLALRINKLKEEGLSIRKIAKEIGIAVNTVQKYLSK